MKPIYLLLVCVLWYSTAVRGQTSREAQNTWALRGKVLPFYGIGSGINYSAGVEYGFSRVHSLVLDLSYTDWGIGREKFDSTTNQYVGGPKTYAVYRSVTLAYRRYIDYEYGGKSKFLQTITGGDGLHYISAFARYCKLDSHNEPGYETDVVAYDDWQYSAGIVIGIMSDYVDFNLGPFYKTHFISETNKSSGSAVLNSSITENFGLRIGFNLYLVMKSNGDHLLTYY